MSAPNKMPVDLKPESLLQKIDQVRKSLQNVILGKRDVIDAVLTSLLAEGSVLLEDVPGVGKTTLAKSLARLIGLEFQRIQCTPDLLPADILGSNVFLPSSGTFEFRAGPIFSNLLIADEINRASPRTQSALLEAMAESQVTIDGKRYTLKSPFIVIATQNPAGFEGTFLLPESQLDRFLMRLTMNYPDADSEISLLLEQADHDPAESLDPLMNQSELVALQAFTRGTKVDRKAAAYIVDIVSATRTDTRLRIGASPRGSKMLLRAAQARAVLLGRDFVLPDDIQSLASTVIAHRVSPRNAMQTSQETSQMISEIVRTIEVPA
ncbi:ATPase family associated with various cellular activities (AAA) [Novipirellula aureliae]|uniref:ATPase family associated with various cellular activities (AAA) n=1 Tax=Novipirellula aureliae TaxID=2527966 RepID=A0A5C6E6X2_9BACT|nr:ATPase family associated with various cellular activities (AAA) [Novipirellula aureliae]